MFPGQVARLAGIGRDVIQFPTVDEPPTVGHHGTLPVLLGDFDALGLNHDRPIGPCGRFVNDQGSKAPAVEPDTFRSVESTELDQGW